MRKTALLKRIDVALRATTREMALQGRGGKYAAGLSSEGYAGGFFQALSDVQLLLNDVEPNDDRHYWHPCLMDAQTIWTPRPVEAPVKTAAEVMNSVADSDGHGFEHLSEEDDWR